MGERVAEVGADEELLSGSSEPARRLLGQLDRVARTPRTTVLLRAAHAREALLAARAIHARTTGTDAEAAFRLCPCQELRAGQTGGNSLAERVASTRGGTLYLAEVSRLSPPVQAELLAALESAAAGLPKDLPRVIASTSEDLEARVDAGEFLEELLYRLNVLVVRIPTLSERIEDLDELIPRILERIGRDLGVSLSAAPTLCSSFNGWELSGGLLELEGVLATAAARALGASPTTSRVGPEHLPRPGGPDSAAIVPAPSDARSLRDVEEATIRRVLAEQGGNRSRAARLLGINRATLYNKLKLYGIS